MPAPSPPWWPYFVRSTLPDGTVRRQVYAAPTPEIAWAPRLGDSPDGTLVEVFGSGGELLLRRRVERR